MFVSPEEQTFKLGDSVRIEAFLVDPALHVMIGSLSDTSAKEVPKTFTIEHGGISIFRHKNVLDPTVEITNSSGEKVAGGVMPFG